MHLLKLHLFLSVYHNEFKDDLEFLILLYLPLEYWIATVFHLPQVYLVLRTEPRASCALGRHTTN